MDGRVHDWPRWPVRVRPKADRVAARVGPARRVAAEPLGIRHVGWTRPAHGAAAASVRSALREAGVHWQPARCLAAMSATEVRTFDPCSAPSKAGLRKARVLECVNKEAPDGKTKVQLTQDLTDEQINNPQSACGSVRMTLCSISCLRCASALTHTDTHVDSVLHCL